MVRQVAGPLLGALFVTAGLDVLKNPEPRARAAAPVIRAGQHDGADGARRSGGGGEAQCQAHGGAGGLLATGIVPRLAAMALAGSTVLTTLGGHRFWELDDQAQRQAQRIQFLKNAAILGGLFLMALD